MVVNQQALIYLNGGLVPAAGPHVSALDRGFALGDGVFDTLRVVGGRPFRLSLHLDRLRRSARALHIPLPVEDSQLESALRLVLSANRLEDALVRITLSRGVPGERGLLPPRDPSPSLAVQATPFHGYPRERYQAGFRGTIASIRRNESSPLSRVKSCSYLDSVLARMEAEARGADEALLLNSSGWLACGASSNLFLLSAGTLITPSLECGVLDGVTRRTVLELAGRLGLGCLQRPLASSELEGAQEAFLTNSALGIMPLVAVDGLPIGSGTPGPTTLRLRKAHDVLLHSPS